MKYETWYLWHEWAWSVVASWIIQIVYLFTLVTRFFFQKSRFFSFNRSLNINSDRITSILHFYTFIPIRIYFYKFMYWLFYTVFYYAKNTSFARDSFSNLIRASNIVRKLIENISVHGFPEKLFFQIQCFVCCFFFLFWYNNESVKLLNSGERIFQIILFGNLY